MARSYFKVRASAELTLDDVMDSKVTVPDGPAQLPTTRMVAATVRRAS